jgi:hypothetical protein
LIRLGWEYEKVKALSILLGDMKVHTKPAPIEYRIPHISIREAKRLALPYFRQAQAQHPEKQWWPPVWNKRWRDPIYWGFYTGCVQDGSLDDDMMIYVAMDKLDGHYVSPRENDRYKAQWKRDSEFLLYSDDLMEGDEGERLRAASWILEHMQHPEARELLEWERDNNPYESVRELIRARLGQGT